MVLKVTALPTLKGQPAEAEEPYQLTRIPGCR